LIKYRLELIVCVPVLAGLFTWYLKLALQSDSAAQAPEALMRQSRFLLYAAGIAGLIFLMTQIDVPSLHWLSSTEPILW
jgi:hypothetical protein